MLSMLSNVGWCMNDWAMMDGLMGTLNAWDHVYAYEHAYVSAFKLCL
jgi:hypothetical protein